MRRRVRTALSVLTLGLVAGCTSQTGNGTVTLAVTDAASDELASLTVELTSVQLTKLGGVPVGALPAPVTLDFTELESVSQVLNVLNVPVGVYSAATITLDFTSASAYLEGETGPATLLDMDGMPLSGTMSFPVVIGNALSVVTDRNTILELDFDLDQSVMVDAMANTVMIEPVLVMRVDRTDPKEFVVVGELSSVNAGANVFGMEVQTLGGTPLTDLDVLVGDTTVYQIDGNALQGAAGLAALDAVPVDTWVQCYGAVNSTAGRLVAAYVEAGSGTYNGGQDIVEGHVVGRVGGAGANATLTVLGHSDSASHTVFQFNTTFTVDVNFTDTRVLQRGSTVNCDTDDLNVGQRVRVFGTLAGMNLDATATTGVVRIQPSRLLGFANGAVSGTTLATDVSRVGLRDESAFTWTEGGTSPPDPDAVVAEVGTLGTGLSIGMGTAVEVIGYFSAVDDAGADFVATSLVNRDLAPSLMLVFDRLGGQTVTPTFSVSDVTLAISGSQTLGEVALIDRGFVGATNLPAAPDPSVVPAFPLGLYLIRDRLTGAVALFLTFHTFTAALDTALLNGATLYNFAAVGQYDDMTNRTTAFLVTAALN